MHGSIAWWMGNNQQQSNMYDWKGRSCVVKWKCSLSPRSQWRGFVDVHQICDLYPSLHVPSEPARWIFVFSVEVVIDHFPFEVREQGWGEFEIEVKVEFKNEAELPVTFTHFLKLHPFNGEPSQENVVGVGSEK